MAFFDSSFILSPSMERKPLSAWSMPPMIFNNVDLPDPEGPRITQNSPLVENLVTFLNKGKMYSWGIDFVNVVRKYEIALYVIIIFSSLFLRNVNSIEKNSEKCNRDKGYRQLSGFGYSDN